MIALGLRKAAITLAGLHPADQGWLLKRLRPDLHSELWSLIGQVKSIRLADSDLLTEAAHACENHNSPLPPPPDRLLAGLEGLSPAWCARVLAACAPDHVEIYAANCAPEEALAVRAEFLKLSSLPPKLAETLTRLVRARGEREPLPANAGVQ